MSASRYFLEQHNQNVNHYNYYYFTNAFTDQELDAIIKLGDSMPKQAAVTGLLEAPTEYRVSDISWIDENTDSRWLYDKVAQYAHKANQEMWNFDIWGYLDSFQYTLYEGGGGHYDWHTDNGASMSTRKLSCVLQLSDPKDYEGGDLEMNIGSSVIQVAKGRGIICFFPSFLLHRVTPLVSGRRISLVTWFSGPNFR